MYWPGVKSKVNAFEHFDHVTLWPLNGECECVLLYGKSDDCK